MNTTQTFDSINETFIKISKWQVTKYTKYIRVNTCFEAALDEELSHEVGGPQHDDHGVQDDASPGQIPCKSMTHGVGVGRSMSHHHDVCACDMLENQQKISTRWWR